MVGEGASVRAYEGNTVCDLRNGYEPSVMRSKGFAYFGVGR